MGNNPEDAGAAVAGCAPAITHAMTARRTTLLPRARLVVVEGCGHMGSVQISAADASHLAEPGYFLTPNPRMN